MITRKLRERETRSAKSNSVSVLSDHKPALHTASTTRAGSSKEDHITIESSDDAGDNELQIADVKPSNVKDKSVVVSVEIASRLRSKSLCCSEQANKEIQLSRSDVPQRLNPYRRSKRNIVPKKETAYGLLWKEEAELQRALNASIQAKRCKELSSSLASRKKSSSLSVVSSPSQKTVERKLKSSPLDSDAGHYYAKMGDCEPVDEDYGQNFTFFGSDCRMSNKQDGRTQVRAQRKFASSSPLDILNFMPNKWTNCKSQKLINSNGKTEDFLTFLCLHRSSILPPHLECFKYGENDSLQSFPSSSVSRGSSCPGTPISLPGPSSDNACILAPNLDSSAKTPSFHRNLLKKTELKSEKKVLPSRNLSKFHPFHSKSLIQKRAKKQAKAIKFSVTQRNEISKVARVDQLRLSSSDSCTHDHLAPRQCIDRTDVTAPSLLSSSETVDTSSLRTELTPESSLKSRLRASTRALSAAVIKEQQMFATRSIAKQLFTTRKEDEAAVNSGKKAKTRLARGNLRDSKDQLQLDTSNIAYYKDLQKEKKWEMANRLRSGTIIGCESPGAITDLRQSTAEVEVSQQVTSTHLFGRASASACQIANVQSTRVPQLLTYLPTVERVQKFSTYTNECGDLQHITGSEICTTDSVHSLDDSEVQVIAVLENGDRGFPEDADFHHQN